MENAKKSKISWKMIEALALVVPNKARLSGKAAICTKVISISIRMDLAVNVAQTMPLEILLAPKHQHHWLKSLISKAVLVLESPIQKRSGWMRSIPGVLSVSRPRNISISTINFTWTSCHDAKSLVSKTFTDRYINFLFVNLWTAIKERMKTRFSVDGYDVWFPFKKPYNCQQDYV